MSECPYCGKQTDGTELGAGFLLPCEACDDEHTLNLLKIDKLTEEGHTHHCACRIVWGDGECECDKKPKPISELIEALRQA